MVWDTGAGELFADLVFEAGHGLVVVFPAADDEAELDAEAEVGGLYAWRVLTPAMMGADRAGSVVVRLGFIVATDVAARLRCHKGEVRHGGQWSRARSRVMRRETREVGMVSLIGGRWSVASRVKAFALGHGRMG